MSHPAEQQVFQPAIWSAPAAQVAVPQGAPAWGQPFNQSVAPRQPVRPFYFDGGAGTYLGTGILAFLITIFTLGLGVPWAICLRYSWRTKHTYINGHRLRFTGSGGHLFATGLSGSY